MTVPEKRPRKTRGGPTAVDRHVGARARERRLQLGMSQVGLAEALGVTFQQVQKYERGISRFGASRLYQVGRVLGVPPTWFFEGLDEPAAPADAAPCLDPVADQETMFLLRSYRSIADPALRRHLLGIVRTAAEDAAARG
jgi:transcriptional regulator with XRE-family HTH domain